jgi:hypothetical protein
LKVSCADLNHVTSKIMSLVVGEKVKKARSMRAFCFDYATRSSRGSINPAMIKASSAAIIGIESCFYCQGLLSPL